MVDWVIGSTLDCVVAWVLQEESIEYVANTIHSLMQPGAGQGNCAAQGGQPGEQGSEPEQEEQQQHQQEQGGDGSAEQEEGQEPAAARKPSRLFLISTYGIGKEVRLHP